LLVVCAARFARPARPVADGNASLTGFALFDLLR
jgi:hypothetical protein